jgi:hypothetical protein
MASRGLAEHNQQIGEWKPQLYSLIAIAQR